MDRRTEIAFAMAALATGVRAVVHGAVCFSSCCIGGSQSMKMALVVAACISWFALAMVCANLRFVSCLEGAGMKSRNDIRKSVAFSKRWKDDRGVI